MLLEKAYAKTFGSYYNLVGGSIHEALSDLTGCPTHKIDDLRSGDNWSILNHWFNEGYLVYGATYLDDAYEGSDWAHYYPIVGVAEGSHQLIKIRNTWGIIQEGTYGEWYKGSDSWDNYPDMAKLCNPQTGDDDSIWMTYSDFIEHFASMNTCMVQDWNETRLPGKFIRVKEASDPNSDMVLSNYFYEINVSKDTDAIISIHQENKNTMGADLRQSIEMNFVILTKDAEGDLDVYSYVDYSS